MEPSSRYEWSKDFVEHLRTVHFSLALLSVALLIAATNEQDRVLARALTQIELISSMSKNWQAVSDRVYGQAMNDNHVRNSWTGTVTYRPNHTTEESVDFVVPVDSFRARQGKPEWRFTQMKWPSQIINLNDFEEFWNNAHHGFGVVMPKAPTVESRCRTYIFAEAAVPEKTRQLGQFPCVWRPVSTVMPRTESESIKDSSTYLVEPEEPDIRPVYVRAVLAINYKIDNSDDEFLLNFGKADRRLAAAGLSGSTFVEFSTDIAHENETIVGKLFFGNLAVGGDFRTAFKELDSNSSEIGFLSFDEAIKRIESEPASSARNVSLFGANIELYQISTWGAIVLVVVQLYFWLHLHELTQRISSDAEGWSVAWIGVYQSKASLWLAILSACVLPAATAALLMIQTIRLHQSRWYLCLSLICCLLSTAIAIGAAVKILALRKERMVDAEQHSLF